MILRKVVHGSAPRSWAASSSAGSRPSTRARTVTATKARLKATWAMMMVTKPRTNWVVTNSDSSEAPRTSSGAEMALKITRS